MGIIIPIILFFGVPIYFIVKVSSDHFSTMSTAMNHYKYVHTVTYMLKKNKLNKQTGVWEKVTVPYHDTKFLTEEQYQKSKEYYDRNGELRKVKRSDFKTESTYLDHGDRRLYIKGIDGIIAAEKSNAQKNLAQQEPPKPKFILTNDAFDKEMNKLHDLYANDTTENLVPILEEAHKIILEASPKRTAFAKESGKWDYFSFLSENQEYIVPYAEYRVLQRLLYDRKVDHPIIQDYIEEMKEIRKLTRSR